VREEVEPLEYVLTCHPYDVRNPQRNKLVRPLQAEVKKRKLWACHLGPELGGQGYGQVKLGLMNEILGARRPMRRSFSAARRPIPATPKSSRITAPPSRRKNICSRCSTTKSYPPFR
jgi:hypothetical protein